MNRQRQPEDGQSIEEIYDSFSLKAWDLPEVMTSFEALKTSLKLDKLSGLRLYKELKPALSNVWKAKEVLSLLDKRAQQKEYLGQKAAKDVRVLIIGAGPVGLRLAIECILLGNEVIVIEKRTTFSRNNVLHLWPFTIDDLRHLGAKKFYGKFCAGAIDHISIRSLQCILLKICLLLGVQIYTNVEFVDVLEPEKGIGWRASVKPESHQVSKCEFDFIVDAGGARRIRIPCFDRKELRGKLALAITANFKNHGTSQEAAVDEISGVAFIFNQKFFKELKAQTGIDLENIVYYKDDTHYFVMTAKKDSLLNKGVLKADSSDVVQLLSRDNINEDNLCKFAAEAASWSTDLPKLDFAYNHHKKRDVALFDFTSIHQTEHAAKAIEKGGKVRLVGDALLEPFWPQGTGCARGFLGAMDTAWLIRGVGQGRSTMDLLCEREIVFQRLPQTTAQKLQKNTEAYTIDPRTRYTNLNLARKLRPDVMERLYKKSDSTASVLSAGVLQGTKEKSTSAEATSSKQVKQHEDKKNVLELPARQKGVSNSSGQKPLLEKGTVHRAYYVNIDDFNTLKSHRELKLWLKKQVKPYGIEVANLSSSWSSGLALCALIHRYRPDLISDIKKLSPANSVENNQLAFSVAEKHLGISSLIKPAEMDQPDRLALVTYLSLFYELFQDSKPATPPNEAGNSVEPPASKAHSVQSTPYKELKSSPDKTTSKKKSDLAVKPVAKLTDSAKKGNFPREDQAANSSSELQIASTKKSQSTVEAQTTSGVVTPTRKQTAVAEKSASSEQRVASSDVQGSADMPLNKHKSSDGKPISSDNQVASSVEAPVKTKKKKRKFRFFRRRNKKTSLATATPSIERRWTTVERPRFKISSKSRQKATELKESSQPGKDGKVSQKNLSASSNEGHQFKPSPLLSSDFCYFCGKRVYVMERMSANGCFFHRNCFRCTHCNCQLQMGNYTLSKGEGGEIGKFFCSPHYRQLFLSHPEVINYSRADPSKTQAKKLDSSSDTLHNTKVEDLRSSSPLIPKKAIKQDDDEVFSSEDEEVANITGKSKRKKSKKMSKKSKTRSESSKSPDVCESPETPRLSKPKKTGWFRKRSSSDSKALKPKSAERSGLMSDLTPTPASPENIGQAKVVKKPSSVAGSNAGQVKRMSALFEALDKNTGTPPSMSERRVGSTTPQFQQLPAISEDSTVAQLKPPDPVATSLRSQQHHATDEKSAHPSAKTLKRGQKNLTRPVASTYSTSDVAIREYRKQQERFTEAQIIQREMSQIETQRDELEEDGRRIESALRDTDDPAEEDELMGQWVNLINERNGLERLAAELNLKMKELELEDRQYEIEKELNELAQISVEELTSEERKTFEELTEQKVAVVLERNKIVDQMEEERVQDQKEGTDAGFEHDYDSPGSSSETEEDFDLQDDQ